MRPRGLAPRILPAISLILATWPLGDNALTGPIAPQLGALSRLSVLDLSGNELGGALPPEQRRADGLVRLVADGNRLTGTVPAPLFGLPLLNYVDLSGNELTGANPPIAESRPDMQGLLLARNRLSGNSLRGATPGLP